MNTLQIGDKVTCIKEDVDINIGIVYVVRKTIPNYAGLNKAVVYLEELANPYYEDYFTLSERVPKVAAIKKGGWGFE